MLFDAVASLRWPPFTHSTQDIATSRTATPRARDRGAPAALIERGRLSARALTEWPIRRISSAAFAVSGIADVSEKDRRAETRQLKHLSG